MVQRIIRVRRDVFGTPRDGVGLVHLPQVAKHVVRVLLPFSRRIGDFGGGPDDTCGAGRVRLAKNI